MLFMVVDSHCHPQFPQYDKDREEMIKRNLNKEVFMVCVGTDLEMSKKAIELSKKYEGIWPTVGFHPADVSENIDVSEFAELVSEKVVAIGEIGLDYYHVKDENKQEIQKKIFLEFLKLAFEFKKPIIIHCREAHDDMLKILMENKDLFNQGVIHSFTEDIDKGKKYIELGFYLGFNGIITFTDKYNNIIKEIPISRILVETDAPFLAPVPYRGKRNEPYYVIEVIKKIAELKGEKIDNIIQQTAENAKNLFKI